MAYTETVLQEVTDYVNGLDIDPASKETLITHIACYGEAKKNVGYTSGYRNGFGDGDAYGWQSCYDSHGLRCG